MVGAPGQATRTGARPDGGQRPQPQAERPGQSGYAGEFDNAEVGKFIDIKRIYAKHRQQKGDSGPFRHPPQLLGLHGLLHEGFLLLCGGMLRDPLCEGDFPQRGEMSRSDRGVRPRKRSRRAGGEREHRLYPKLRTRQGSLPPSASLTALPLQHFVPPPPYRGSLSHRGSLLTSFFLFLASLYCTLCGAKFQLIWQGFTSLTQTSPATAHAPASQCRAASGSAWLPI